MMNTKNNTPKVANYSLFLNGHYVRQATLVRLADGREFRFTERMSRREVFTNLENLLAMAIRHDRTEEAKLFTDAIEEFANRSSFPAVSA